MWQHLEKNIKNGGWVDNDEKFHSHDERYGFGGPLPHYAMDAQQVGVGRAVLKKRSRKLFLAGKVLLLSGDLILFE